MEEQDCLEPKALQKSSMVMTSIIEAFLSTLLFLKVWYQPVIAPLSKSTYAKVLDLASTISGHKVKHIAHLRLLPYEVLYAVNSALVQESPYGTFTFGPTLDYVRGDRSYVPDYPLRRLAAGRMARMIKIMVGQRRNEGSLLVPSTMATDHGFKAHLAQIFPTVAPRHIEYMNNSLYPSSDYVNQGGMRRSTEALYDFFVGCNTNNLLKLMNRSFGYLLDTEWAGQDEFFQLAFFRGSMGLASNSSTTAAEWLQDEILRFALFDSYKSQTSSVRPYNSSGKVRLILDGGPKNYINDPTSKHQCRYWTDAPYEKVISWVCFGDILCKN